MLWEIEWKYIILLTKEIKIGKVIQVMWLNKFWTKFVHLIKMIQCIFIVVQLQWMFLLGKYSLKIIHNPRYLNIDLNLLDSIKFIFIIELIIYKIKIIIKLINQNFSFKKHRGSIIISSGKLSRLCFSCCIWTGIKIWWFCFINLHFK